jgi:hypothetical protein
MIVRLLRAFIEWLDEILPSDRGTVIADEVNRRARDRRREAGRLRGPPLDLP